MTVSSSVAFSPNFIEAIEEAFERATGMDMGSPRSGYEMRSARRSINLLFADWANRGVNLWTISERTQALTYGVGSYDLTALTGNDVVDVIEQVVQIPTATTGPSVARLNMSRVSISAQATRTNPNILGRPTEVWYDRRTDGVTAHIWPLPDATGSYVLIYTVLRRMDDAGAYTNTADMPFRLLPAFIAGLAYYIAQKKLVGTDQSGYTSFSEQRIARLQQDYETTWQRAADEDRDKSPLMIVPRGDAYRVN